MRPRSRLVMRAERWDPSTGTTWGPFLSLYWITKESNSPSGTVQRRSRELEVWSVTASSPRRGGAEGFPGFGPSLSGTWGQKSSRWTQTLPLSLVSFPLLSPLGPSFLDSSLPQSLHFPPQASVSSPPLFWSDSISPPLVLVSPSLTKVPVPLHIKTTGGVSSHSWFFRSQNLLLATLEQLKTPLSTFLSLSSLSSSAEPDLEWQGVCYPSHKEGPGGNMRARKSRPWASLTPQTSPVFEALIAVELPTLKNLHPQQKLAAGTMEHSLLQARLPEWGLLF